MNPPRNVISTTPTSWFLRGFMSGLLLAAALNAISYFFRSDAWGDLVGVAPERREALGFPWELWERGNNYDGWFIDPRGLVVDLSCAALFGVAAGLVTLGCQQRLNRLVAEFEQMIEPPARNFQVSLRGLLVLTTLIAAVSALATQLNFARPEVLWTIYGLGPWLLIAVAFLPRRIPWEQRAVILIPMAGLTMGLAVYVGVHLPRALEFDKVLLGIFICWTPQTVLVSLAISLAVLTFYRPKVGSEEPS